MLAVWTDELIPTNALTQLNRVLTSILPKSKTEKQKRTSYTEDRVDALALWTEEGRGDRRNVPGELHASVDPGDSEWGNPSRVMSGDPHLNP